MTHLSAGRVLGRFRVIAPLGRGGMAAVYRAEEVGLGREIALKVLPAELMDQSGFLERFEREARVIAHLEHPNIVPLYASGIDEGIPWMALRLLTHGTLQDRLEAGSLELEEGLTLFAQIAKALDHAHGQGVLHRDLKPQNVLLGGDGSAYLADFGIARLLSGTSVLTGTGAVLGTPPYMAPEQAQGEELGPPCDRYALAVMLYRWLCGQVPFDADTPLAVLMKQVQAPVPTGPMNALPPDARAVLLKGLEKDPQQRWPSSLAMVQALDRAMRPGATSVTSFATGSAARADSARTASHVSQPSAKASRGGAMKWVVAAAVLVGIVIVASRFRPMAEPGPAESPQAARSEVPSEGPGDGTKTGTESSQRAGESELREIGQRESGQPGEGSNAMVQSSPGPREVAQDDAGANAASDGMTDAGLPPHLDAVASDEASRDAAPSSGDARSPTASESPERIDPPKSVVDPTASQRDAGNAPTPTPARIEDEARTPSRAQPPADPQSTEAEPVVQAQSGSVPRDGVAAPPATPADDVALVRDIQNELRRLGRDVPGSGALDDATRAGIEAFSNASGNDVRGLGLGAVLAALKSARTWPSSVPAPGSVFRDCPQCPELVVIPAGRFVMGSPNDEPQRMLWEGPQHEVDVKSFAMGKFETRFAEWDACLADGGCSHRPDAKGWGGGAQPVMHVSWNDAQAYLAWLSRKTGQHYRLPSEAEWEYAARAGTTGRHYAGDCFSSETANFHAGMPAKGCSAGQFRRRTVAVGSFPPNPFGLHDMHGNVWEWTQDCDNSNYRGAPTDGSAWMSGNCRKAIVRGAGWHDWGFWLRSAARFGFVRAARHPYGGFRVVRVLP